MPEQVVTLTKVKTPWYAIPFLLKKGFRKAVPEFESVEGLLFKYFSSVREHGVSYFGGIYLWENRNATERQFSSKWFERVKKRYKDPGRVEYYALTEAYSDTSYDYRATRGNCVAVFIHGLTLSETHTLITHYPEILRRYVVEEGELYGCILLFRNDNDVQRIMEATEAKRTEVFQIPVFALGRINR